MTNHTDGLTSIELSALRTAVINYAAKQSGWSFDPRMLSTADIDVIGDVMVNDDTLDLSAVIMLATLLAGDVPEASNVRLIGGVFTPRIWVDRDKKPTRICLGLARLRFVLTVGEAVELATALADAVDEVGPTAARPADGD